MGWLSGLLLKGSRSGERHGSQLVWHQSGKLVPSSSLMHAQPKSRYLAARCLSKQSLTVKLRFAGGSNTLGKPVSLIGDIVESLCCHPAYRMLSLRSVPQMPAASLDFTTFSWTAILRRLRQMQITGACWRAHAAVMGPLKLKLCCAYAVHAFDQATQQLMPC